MKKQPILVIEKINKSFPGVRALKDVDMEIFKGDVHAIVGENGAGKSTLIKIISGVYTKDSGRILYDGDEYWELAKKKCFNSRCLY